MQEFEKDYRLCLLHDTETGDEVWLRRHRLHLNNREYMEYIRDAEERGSANPMTEDEIATFFHGEYDYSPQYGLYGSKNNYHGGRGFCYHPTQDIQENDSRDRFEAPSVGHVLWSMSDDEITIQSVVADADFHFRTLMYEILLGDMKTLVIRALGHSFTEKISTLLKRESDRSFWKQRHFREVQMPEGVRIMYWRPEFEGCTKENRRPDQSI